MDKRQSGQPETLRFAKIDLLSERLVVLRPRPRRWPSISPPPPSMPPHPQRRVLGIDPVASSAAADPATPLSRPRSLVRPSPAPPAAPFAIRAAGRVRGGDVLHDLPAASFADTKERRLLSRTRSLPAKSASTIERDSPARRSKTRPIITGLWHRQQAPSATLRHLSATDASAADRGLTWLLQFRSSSGLRPLLSFSVSVCCLSLSCQTGLHSGSG